MSETGWIWDELGIAETGDPAEIRRAYARRLKRIDSEADPRAFIALRAARDSALALAAGEAVGPGSWAPPRFEHPEPPPSDPLPWHPPAPPPPPPAAGTVESSPSEPGEPDLPPPDPGPMPRMFVPQSALPELDTADLEHVDALLEAPDPPSWAELEQATRRVLDSPASERIDIARWLEGWAAERITAFTPRSDPMIEPAVEHFRWHEEPDLNRPPVVDWIMHRRIDRDFEVQLGAHPGGFARLIKELRKPMASPPGRLAAWWKGPRVEFLLAYLEALNPTILAGLNPETVGWWRSHIHAQSETPKPVQAVREWRRKAVWNGGITGSLRPVEPFLLIGLIVVPYIAAWFLLQRGYGVGVRVLGFGWLAFLVLAVLVAPPPAEQMYKGKSIEPHWLDMETDVAPIVEWATEDNMSLAGIADRKPHLHGQLSDRWTEAAAVRENGERFRQSVVEILGREYCEESAAEDAQRICAGIMAQRAAAAPNVPAPSGMVYRGPPVIPAYRDMAADVDPILGWMTGGEVAVKDLEAMRYGLYRDLQSAWQNAAGENMLAGPFSQEIARTIAVYAQTALREAPYPIQAEYWRLRADMATIARGRGDYECESAIRGSRTVPVAFPPEIEAREKAFTAKAVHLFAFGSLSSFGGRSGTQSLSVPPAIASRAAYYAHLTPPDFAAAMVGRGTQAQRCDARIGLAEALLAADPEKALPVMQQLAGGY